MKSILRKSKFISLLILSVLFVCSVFGIVATSRPQKSSADTTSSYTFEMVVGGSIRTTDPVGLRFCVKVDETFGKSVIDSTTQTFGALIVPNDYLTANDITGDYVNQLTDKGISFISKEDLQLSTKADEDGLYRIAYSITNVKDKNMDREFFGIFYVKDTSGDTASYQYATFDAGENVRSIAYVAEGVIGEYEDDEDVKDTLQSYIDTGATYTINENITTLNGKSELSGSDYSLICGAEVMYGRLTESQKKLVDYESLETVKENYLNKYDVVMLADMTSKPTYGYNGDNQEDNNLTTNNTYGNMYYDWKNGKDNSSIILTSSKDLSGYKVYVPIIFDLTAVGSVETAQVQLNSGKDKYDGTSIYVSLKANRILEFDGAIVNGNEKSSNNASNLMVYASGKVKGTMYFAPIYAAKEKTAEEIAATQALKTQIEGLMDKNTANTLVASDYSYIIGVETVYSNFRPWQQALVTNYADLATVKTAYLAKYDVVMLADMTSKPTYGYNGDNQKDNNLTTNDTYGNMYYDWKNGNDNSSIILTSSQDLSDYKVYVPIIFDLTAVESVETAQVQLNSGKDKYDGTSIYVSLKANQILEFDGAIVNGNEKSSKNASNLMVYASGKVKGTMYFAPIYAAKEREDYAVVSGIDALDASLDKTNLPIADYSKIIGLDSLYNALDNKDGVTNYSKLTQIKELYAAKYDIKIIKDMSEGSLEKGEYGELWGTTTMKVAYKTDSTYGNVAVFTATGSNMNFKISLDSLSGYTICVPVYLDLNVGTEAKVCYDYNATGGGNSQTVSEGGWTVCEYAYVESTNGKSQIFIRNEVQGNYTFAAIYAVKAK